MKADTLNMLKAVLDPPSAPRCVFIVHAFKEQIEDMVDEIKIKAAHYKTKGRQVMYLMDTESTDAALSFFNTHRGHIKDEKGWIFISHRGVSRGLDLNGPEAATMIINFRFANTTELT
jgi:urease gamma subunit